VSHKILILEDNELLLVTLEEFLSDNGYIIKIAMLGEKALELSYEEDFDLFLLDVKVPDISGFEFLRQMRDSGDNTPAIFLTSLRDKESLGKGFRVGGDDYIKKPFDLDELLFRVKAVLSRRSDGGEFLEIDEHFYMDIKRKRLFQDGKDLNINLKDFQLLKLLMQDRGRVVTMEMIIEELWKNEEANFGSLRVYITNLKKIFGKKMITNLRGLGYKFEK